MRLRRVLSVSGSAPRLLVGAAREVFGADRAGTLAACGLQLLGALAALGVVATAKLSFDALLRPDRTLVELAPALTGLALSTALSTSVGSLQTQQMRLLGERVAQHLWGRVMDRTARADLISYEAAGFATALERIQKNALTSPFVVATGLIGTLGGLLGVLTLSVALIRIEPLLVPILLSAGLPAVALSRWASRTEFRFAHRMTAAHRRRDYLRELLTVRPYAAELRAFGSTGRLRARHGELDQEYTDGLRAQVRRRQVIAMLSAGGVGLALAAALLAIIVLVDRGRIGLPEAGAAAIAVRLLSGQLTTVFAALGALIESAPFLVDLNSFVTSGEPPVKQGTKRTLRDGLRLEGISFHYPGEHRAAVEDVDIEIRAGEVVALVGENGSGKTTLAKIVAGLYDPDRGTRRWDGDDVAAADIRTSISVIFQDFVRYQMTLRDNIAISGSDHTTGDLATDDRQVIEAARRAGVLRVVSEAHAGLDTMLGRDLDEGVDLSGGQWQRVALARALHRGTSLVVLDEPTAALDPRAEHELFSDVRAVLDGRAALLISHRFSSTRLADRIYVLDGGRVVESGTHDALMARAGQYAELYTLQSAGYS